ncbi:MAG TPA: helix-turn-helix domain-containing protein [Sporichthyaceae bacterium]|jgi:sugar diacid utilization regulator|nr:helix-turn-helix domain-containing protein [Sporichthyaceae bacterium]
MTGVEDSGTGSSIVPVVLDRLQQRWQEVVARAVDRIWDEIPGYPAVRDPGLREDVAAHIGEHVRSLRSTLAGDAPPSRETLLFSRRHTALRVGRVPIADYLKAFRITQEIIWDVLVESAQAAGGPAAVLELVGPLLDHINLATTYAAELYIEIEQLDMAGGERVRRDLLEDLVASRPVPPGPRRDAARDAGLGRDIPCLVVLALPRAVPEDEQVIRSAAGALARACGTRLRPLVVMRRDEIVLVAPTRDSDIGQVIAELSVVAERLAKQDVRLAIGLSTVHQGLAGVASAHREARGAAESLGPDGGVLALPSLSAFDYLTSFHDSTAQRLVPAAIHQFVADDIAHGGVLTTTLLAYLASDLNVKVLSERLRVHTNTAHYRLNRISEQTGYDLRKLDCVLELVIATRLAQPLGDRPPGVWA